MVCFPGLHTYSYCKKKLNYLLIKCRISLINKLVSNSQVGVRSFKAVSSKYLLQREHSVSLQEKNVSSLSKRAQTSWYRIITDQPMWYCLQKLEETEGGVIS